MTLNQLAKETGKSPQVILNLISRYGLEKTRVFSAGYAVLLRKLIALSICSVAQKDTETLLLREKNLLKLLKADSLRDASTWFEDLCITESGPTRLLLSGFDLGHPVTSDSIQTSFDFANRETELFSSKEMGADALRTLKLYVETCETVLGRIRAETRTLAFSLKWTRQISRSTPVSLMSQVS